MADKNEVLTVSFGLVAEGVTGRLLSRMWGVDFADTIVGCSASSRRRLSTSLSSIFLEIAFVALAAAAFNCSLLGLGSLRRLFERLSVLALDFIPFLTSGRSAILLRELAVVAVDTGCLGRELRRGGEVFGGGADMYALRLEVLIFPGAGRPGDLLCEGGVGRCGDLLCEGGVALPAGLQGLGSGFRILEPFGGVLDA